MANYDERHIQAFMSKVYAAYMKDIMNPFIASIDDHKLTKKFHANLDSIVVEYQAILKKSVWTKNTHLIKKGKGNTC